MIQGSGVALERVVWVVVVRAASLRRCPWSKAYGRACEQAGVWGRAFQEKEQQRAESPKQQRAQPPLSSWSPVAEGGRGWDCQGQNRVVVMEEGAGQRAHVF